MFIAALWFLFRDFYHRDTMDAGRRIRGFGGRVFVREIFLGKFSGIVWATHYVWSLPSPGLGTRRGAKW